MRRLSGFFVACVMVVLPLSLPVSVGAQAAAGTQPAAAAQQPAAAAQPAPVKVTFTGDIALWAFKVKADKTADYEKVLEKLKTAMAKITRPEVKQQMAGWKVLRNTEPQDGAVLYIHVISPVVKDADYSMVNLFYEAFPEYADRKAFYDLYAASVQAPFFLIQGPVPADLSK